MNNITKVNTNNGTRYMVGNKLYLYFIDAKIASQALAGSESVAKSSTIQVTPKVINKKSTGRKMKWGLYVMADGIEWLEGTFTSRVKALKQAGFNQRSWSDGRGMIVKRLAA